MWLHPKGAGQDVCANIQPMEKGRATKWKEPGSPNLIRNTCFGLHYEKLLEFVSPFSTLADVTGTTKLRLPWIVSIKGPSQRHPKIFPALRSNGGSFGPWPSPSKLAGFYERVRFSLTVYNFNTKSLLCCSPWPDRQMCLRTHCRWWEKWFWVKYGRRGTMNVSRWGMRGRWRTDRELSCKGLSDSGIISPTNSFLD